MATHAFLVLAHTDPPMCHRLVSRLSEHGPVHLNVNARVDAAPFAASLALARPLRSRASVRWGSWSIVEATLRLASQALLDPDVETVTWVSGQHYPVVHPKVIASASPTDRIALNPAPDASIGKPEWRFRTRFISWFPPESRRDVVANSVVRRLPPLDHSAVLGPHQLYAGTAWWSLTRETLTAAMEWLDAEKEIRRYFSRLYVPDESVFHTAVGAVLTERAREREDRDPHPVTKGSTTYVLWGDRAHPEDLDADSIRQACRVEWWFARKFSSTRPELIDVAESCW